MNPLIFKTKEDVIKFYQDMKNGLGINLINKYEETLREYNLDVSLQNGITESDMPYINYLFKSKDKSKNKKHTVMLVYDGNSFTMYCGEKDDDFCNFTTGENLYNILDNKEVCKHILTVACTQSTTNTEYMLDDLISVYNQKFKNQISINPEPEEEFKKIKKYAFKIPVLVEGDRGSGKTYEAFEYAKSLGIEPSFVGGHAGIESIDLLGCLVPYQSNTINIEDTQVSANDFFSGSYSMNINNSSASSLIWKDGPIAEAFRKAQNGEKAILIIDELLRIPQRELNILLTALSPIGGRYHLRTGRILEAINGVAKEEVLSCETKNLFVLATTNVGGQYAVDSIDPALAERFMLVRKDTEFDKLVIILRVKAEEKGFDTELANKAGIFFNRMLSAKEQGIIEECPTLRTLSRAFELAEIEDEVKEYIFEQHLLWVSRDVYGRPDILQIEAVQKMLNDF